MIETILWAILAVVVLAVVLIVGVVGGVMFVIWRTERESAQADMDLPDPDDPQALADGIEDVEMFLEEVARNERP